MRYFFRLCAITCAMLVPLQNASAAFSDTAYSWYSDSIDKLRTSGTIRGFPDGTFRPEASVTRAEFLKIAMASAKIPTDNVPTSACFGDVPVASWIHQYACTAARLGIAKGYGDGNFAPAGHVTVLEALAIGLRAFGVTPPPVGDAAWYDAYRSFADAKNIVEIHNYLLGTEISRWRAAELVDRIRTYAITKKTLDYRSVGCTNGGSLQTKNAIAINGVDRSYNLFVPSDYTKSKSYGLVIAFHGRTSGNDAVQGYMGLQGSRGYGRAGSGATKQNDFIVAYPAGLPVSGGYSWGGGSVEFFDAMISQIAKNYCIDRDQVFIVGHSLGAGFAQDIACRRGEILRGMSAVAGSAGASKNCTGPVASLLWHNQGDPLVPYSSGKSAEWIRKNLNACSLDRATNVTVGTYQCKQWSDCATGDPVVWCEGYQTSSNDLHGWPKYGGSAILSFFRGIVSRS